MDKAAAELVRKNQEHLNKWVEANSKKTDASHHTVRRVPLVKDDRLFWKDAVKNFSILYVAELILDRLVAYDKDSGDLTNDKETINNAIRAISKEVLQSRH